MSDDETFIVSIVPVEPVGAYIPARRIRDLWSRSLGETGLCPKCHVALGETHAQPCKWRGTVVGSNEAEHWL